MTLERIGQSHSFSRRGLLALSERSRVTHHDPDLSMPNLAEEALTSEFWPGYAPANQMPTRVPAPRLAPSQFSPIATRSTKEDS